MRINFRQGLVSYQQSIGHPVFMQQGSPWYVSLQVAPTSTIVAFAHGDTDYLEIFDTTVIDAWGQLTPIVANYLYFDIDLLTSDVSYGITLLAPINSVAAPINPKNDQHWFDLSTTTMKVWSTSSNKWKVKIRVFAGVVQGTTITAYTEGSQVGLNTPSNPGFIILDSVLQPLRNSKGEFLTNTAIEYVRSTVGTSGVLISLSEKTTFVRAGENIPAMSLVYFSDNDVVRISSSDPAIVPPQIPVGIITQALATGEIGTLVSFGEIVYDQWNFSGLAGKPLYHNQFGEITSIRPAGMVAFRIGFVKNAHSIIISIDSETQPAVYQSDVNDLVISGTPPLNVIDVLNQLGERVVSLSVSPATAISSGLMTAAQFTQLVQNATDQTLINQQIAELETTKSDVGHTHPISDVLGLQTMLDSKFPANGNFDTKYALINHNHDGIYSLIGHTHPINEVIGLQTALNNKSNRVHLNSFSEIYTTVDRSTSVDQGSGQTLLTVLNGKSNIGHTHVIGDTTGLQAVLDSKASLVHTHSIADVIGLQFSLNTLTTNVNSVTLGLAGKANLIHTHLSSDITDLDSVTGTLKVKTVNGSYSLTLADMTNTLLRVNSQSSAVVYLPSNNTLAAKIGSSILIGWSGIGSVSVAGENTDVVINTPDTLQIATRHGKLTAIKVGLNEWDIEGNLSPGGGSTS